MNKLLIYIMHKMYTKQTYFYQIFISRYTLTIKRCKPTWFWISIGIINCHNVHKF